MFVHQHLKCNLLLPHGSTVFADWLYSKNWWVVMEMHTRDSQASWICTTFTFTIHYLSFIHFFEKKRKEESHGKEAKLFGPKTHQWWLWETNKYREIFIHPQVNEGVRRRNFLMMWGEERLIFAVCFIHSNNIYCLCIMLPFLSTEHVFLQRGTVIRKLLPQK